MPDETLIQTIARSRYVSLTTFRKSGEPVSTAMWAAQDHDGSIIFSTHVDSGKVKRLKNNVSVELRPSSASAAVKPDAVVVAGTAELIFDESKREPFVALLRRKYGIQQRLLAWVESVRKSRHVDRVILKITPS